MKGIVIGILLMFSFSEMFERLIDRQLSGMVRDPLPWILIVVAVFAINWSSKTGPYLLGNLRNKLAEMLKKPI